MWAWSSKLVHPTHASATDKQELEVSFVTLLASFPDPFKFGLSPLVSRASPFSGVKRLREGLSGEAHS